MNPRFPLQRHLLRLGSLVAILLPGSAALAGTPTNASSVTWSDLSPGDDWAARTLDSLFPISTSAQTVTGTMLQYLSAYAMLIAAFWLAYATILQVHRSAESGKILSTQFTGWVPVRIITALLLMVPVINGYSMGQVIVLQAAKTGIGMARNLTDVVANAIGPQALPLAEPIIPGTRRIVMGVMESELCRALLNDASGHNGANGTSDLVPAPSLPNEAATKISSSGIGVRYALASGDSDGSATCGSLQLTLVEQTKQNLFDTNLDLTSMTDAQIAALKNLISTVRPEMQVIADSLWNTRSAAALTSMDGVLADANSTYSAALTAAASKMLSAIRNANSKGGDASSDPGYVALQNLGWTGLGAYYLELSRLNSEVLSLAAIVPAVNSPTWRGLGPYLTKDIAPLVDAIQTYQNSEDADLSASDTASAPSSALGVFGNEALPASPQTTLDKAITSFGLSNKVMAGIVNLMASPTSGDSWTDPLAALIGLGHMLIHIALLIIGGSALLSSKVGGIGTAIASALSLDPAGVVAGLGATAMSGVIKALLIPIFGGALLLLGPGITLAYVLPMTPYIYWIAGVAGWFLLVVEAMIAVPLWGLAHLAFQGEGLHGRAIRGYEMLFSILFRPVIMIAGLLVSYSIFAALSWLLMKSFTIATGFVFQQGWLTDNWIGLMILLCVFATTEMGLAMMCFRLITTLPHHIPAIAGMSSISRVDSDRFADETTGRGMDRATGKVRDLAQDAIGALGPDARHGKQNENSRSLENDGTVQAYMRPIGRQED